MKALAFILLLVFSSTIFAATEYAKNKFYFPSYPSDFFETQEAACTSNAPRHISNSGTLISAVMSYAGGGTNALGTCWIKYTPYNQTGTGVASVGVSTSQSCPAGYSLGPPTANIYQRLCTISSCPTGTTYNATTDKCVDNCDQFKGQIGTFSLNCSSQTNAGQGVCFPNNCAATITDSSSARVGTCWYGYNQAKYTGLTCSGQPSTASFVNPSNTQPPPADSDQANCIKNGQSFGTVNGVTVCVPKTSASATPVTSSSQTSISTKNTDATGNSTTQNSTEVKSVTQDGDQVTSQIIKNNPDGTKSETTVTQSYDDFCASNPNQKICKKANDEDTSSACEDNPDLPQCYQRGEADDGDTIGESTRTVSFAAKSITSAASCPSNKSMSAFGRSLTIDYSPVCTYAADFKPFILAFAYLSAAMFLFWGYRGSQA